MPIYLIDPGDQIEAASWQEAAWMAARLGARLDGELVEEVQAAADDFDQYRKSVPKLAKAVIQEVDALDDAIGPGEPKKIVTKARRALKAARRAFEKLAEPSPVGNIRPGIVNAIERWRDNKWGSGYAIALAAFVEIEERLKVLSKLGAKYIDDLPESIDLRIRKGTDSIRKCAEAAIKAIPKMADVSTVPQHFKLGPFTVTDDYGCPEDLAGAWFDAVRYAVKMLNQKGLGYLCYGKLVLSLGVGAGGAWSGLYQQPSDTISLALRLSQTQTSRPPWKHLVRTLIHELGHRLWFKFLDAGQRDTFATPWIDQDTGLRDLREKIWALWEISVQEREKAFKVAWDSGFDTTVFRKWLKEDPLRAMRWTRWLEFAYPAGVDYVHGPMAWKGKLFGKSWSELKKHMAYLKSSGANDSYIAKFHKKNFDQFMEPKAGYQSYFTDDALQWAYEPSSASGTHPLAKDIQESMKIAKITPSVSDYGNTNRREDFAESFADVVTGQEKSRQIQMRIQRALPKGRVVSEVVELLDRGGHQALAALLVSRETTRP